MNAEDLCCEAVGTILGKTLKADNIVNVHYEIHVIEGTIVGFT